MTNNIDPTVRSSIPAVPLYNVDDVEDDAIENDQIAKNIAEESQRVADEVHKSHQAARRDLENVNKRI